VRHYDADADTRLTLWHLSSVFDAATNGR